MDLEDDEVMGAVRSERGEVEVFDSADNWSAARLPDGTWIRDSREAPWAVELIEDLNKRFSPVDDPEEAMALFKEARAALGS